MRALDPDRARGRAGQPMNPQLSSRIYSRVILAGRRSRKFASALARGYEL